MFFAKCLAAIAAWSILVNVPRMGIPSGETPWSISRDPHKLKGD